MDLLESGKISDVNAIFKLIAAFLIMKIPIAISYILRSLLKHIQDAGMD